MKVIEKSDKPYLFEDYPLPVGFRFPESYLFLLEKRPPDIEPWEWLASYKELSISWMNIIKKQFPYRTVIPFAKRDDSDDVSCFDGTDTSGNPKIIFIHTFCSPGSENRGEANNFDDWLEVTKEESRQFKLGSVEN